jgi:hypothetical protein
MADIAKKASNAANSSTVTFSTATLDIEESLEQMTLPLAADTDEGVPVYVNSSGKFAQCDASVIGTAGFYGITTRKGKAGEPVTAIARGVVGGFTLTQNFGTDVFLSDTTGKLADAAGTVSRKVGEVIPAYGQPRGGTPAKLLRITG